MYLLINAGGKYWRVDYRIADKRKTLTLGVQGRESNQATKRCGPSSG